MPLYRNIKVKNLGGYARIDRKFPALSTVSIPVADGFGCNNYNSQVNTMTASISGFTINISGLTGFIMIGHTITGGTTAPGTVITAQTGGSPGSNGTYTVNISQSVASGPKSAAFALAPTNFAVILTPGAVTENFQQSSFYSPTGDVGTFINGLNVPFWDVGIRRTRIKMGVELSPSMNCNLTPLLHNGYGGTSAFSYTDISGEGSPKLIPGHGYGGGFDVDQNEWTWITREFIYKGFCNGLGYIGLYRNIKTTNNVNLNVSVRKFFLEVEQLDT